MRWLWFLGSLACFAVVFRTTSIALALLCLVGALAFMLIGTLAVAAQRIERNRSDGGRLFSPDELRQMREADARRKAEQEAGTADSAEPAIVGTATMAALIATEAAGRGAEPVLSPPAPAPDAEAEPQGGDNAEPTDHDEG